MNRVLALLLIAAMIGGAVLTYNTKHQAEAAGEQVTRLRQQVAKTQSDIGLLRAEWSVLTHPARLQALTEQFKAVLGLATMDVNQIVTVDDIPTKPLDAMPVASTRPATVVPRPKR